MKWLRDWKFVIGTVAIPIALAMIGWLFTKSPNQKQATTTNQGIITQGQTGNNVFNIQPLQPGTSEREAEIVIHAECHKQALSATPVPADEGRIYVLQLQPNDFGGLAEFFSDGGKIKWPKPPGSFPLIGYRCKVTDYASFPVFNVEVALEATFNEVVHNPDLPNQKNSGAAILSKKLPIAIAKVDAGATKPFVFYIFNMSDTFASVSLPQSVTLQIGAANMRRNVPLARPDGLMSFSPDLYP